MAVASADAPVLWEGLSGKALPAVLLSAVLALLANYALFGRRYRLARALAIAQVAMMLGAWAKAQSPYLIVPDVTIDSAASPTASMVAFAVAIGIGALLLLPSLWYLLRVFKGRNPAQQRS